ncbi:superinfection immunity protein [Streptomyces sp. NPDC050147]|uniref:superinfection immunity protein n=1 Tax=Streptomyces sp. NPDC050147 TaxID=3155513 RepID=UPI003439FCE4
MFGSLGPLIATVLGLLSLIFYLLPSLIAFNRGIENRYLVLVVNIVFGASVIGWLIALYLAARKVKSPLPGTA